MNACEGSIPLQMGFSRENYFSSFPASSPIQSALLFLLILENGGQSSDLGSDSISYLMTRVISVGIDSRRISLQDQAYRVAWRNLLDWVVAQMTLLEIEMVKLEEVFLPYVVFAEGKTLFEVFETHQFQLPLPQET